MKLKKHILVHIRHLNPETNNNYIVKYESIGEIGKISFKLPKIFIPDLAFDTAIKTPEDLQVSLF